MAETVSPGSIHEVPAVRLTSSILLTFEIAAKRLESHSQRGCLEYAKTNSTKIYLPRRFFLQLL
jgi:hypothetical protein